MEIFSAPIVAPEFMRWLARSASRFSPNNMDTAFAPAIEVSWIVNSLVATVTVKPDTSPSAALTMSAKSAAVVSEVITIGV